VVPNGESKIFGESQNIEHTPPSMEQESFPGSLENAKYETIEIGNLLDLINRFTVSVRPDPSIVWRGQSCSEWGLTPSLFRSEPKRKGWTWQSKEDELLRYFIPKEIKQNAFAKLWSLGIRYESLFPDPEGAAKGAKYVIDTEDDSISRSN
jgi:hypothetical protein